MSTFPEKPLLGVSLDANKSISNETGRQLYFTGGSFTTPWSVKAISDFVINLNAKEYQCDTPCLYDVFYNPTSDSHQILEKGTPLDCHPGYLIGGFQINGCDFIFLEAKCKDFDFVRSFGDIFNQAFQKESCECKGDYNVDAFSNAFNKECIVTSNPNTNDGAFVIRSFTNAFSE